jgi:hypothetical protein
VLVVLCCAVCVCAYVWYVYVCNFLLTHYTTLHTIQVFNCGSCGCKLETPMGEWSCQACFTGNEADAKACVQCNFKR